MNQAKWEKAKRLVNARDGGLCLRCLAESTVVHHRMVRGSGGSSDDDRNYGLANLVSLCSECHEFVHSHPTESYATGFLVHSWSSPEGEFLVVKPGSVFVQLTKDGRMEKFEQATLF